MKTTTWSPDTCACVIEFEWDEKVPSVSRVHTHKRTVKFCPEHAAVADGAPLFSTILSENRMKNDVLQVVATAERTRGNTVDDAEMATRWRWSTTGRVLEITGTRLNARTDAATALATKYGTKVRIV